MSDVPDLLPLDEEPSRGVYVDHDELNLSDEELAAEIAEGNRQGAEVDPDDDLDNGLPQ